MAGRYVLMLFYGTAERDICQQAFRDLAQHRDLFDDQQACFFGITVEKSDVEQRRVRSSIPGIRHLLDEDRAVSRQFGVMFPSPKGEVHRPCWMLLDQGLRLIEYRPIAESEAIFARLRSLLDEGVQLPARVLMIPRVFEPDLCRKLIATYEAGDPYDSGYMIEKEGKTVGVVNHSFKRRSDCSVEDMALRDRIRDCLSASVIPMIKRAYQFEVTRVERWIVARYDGEVGGFFNRHRDNTTAGTAHRKFACTINLNDDFDGGGVAFPEFSSQVYRPPTGGAVIFSCSLLHEAMLVTRGLRYAFLPFFYDEAGAELRTANNDKLGESVKPYLVPRDEEAEEAEATA